MQFQCFLSLLKGFDAHNDKISLAIFGDIDGFRFIMRQMLERSSGLPCFVMNTGPEEMPCSRHYCCTYIVNPPGRK